MVAVCVIATSLFPVTVSIEDMPGQPGRLTARVRQENGDLTTIELSPARSQSIREKHGSDLTTLAGIPWQQILAGL
jgi:hypothetical protein